MKLLFAFFIAFALVGCNGHECEHQVTEYEAEIEGFKQAVQKRDSIIAYQHQELKMLRE